MDESDDTTFVVVTNEHTEKVIKSDGSDDGELGLSDFSALS